MIEIPETIHWWARDPAGAAWLASLPRLAEECAERWGLVLGRPLPGGHVSLTLAATRQDGMPAVVKLRMPDEESRFEADALALWDGCGAARLLERDDDRWALLIERLDPGTSLLERPDDEAVETVGSLLHTLHAVPAPDGPFTRLADVATTWAENLPRRWERLGRPFERRLLDTAVDACAALPDDASPVVLHQDLHAGNVLRDGDGWRVIDPKPLLGDAAFDCAAIVRDRRHPALPADLEGVVARRLDQIVAATGYDRARVRAWGITHTLAWGMSDHEIDEGMVACARALLRAR